MNKLPELCKQGMLVATFVNLRKRTTKNTIMMTAKTIQAAIAPVHEVDIPSSRSAAETHVEQFDFTGSQVVVFITSVVVNASVVVIIRSSLI